MKVAIPIILALFAGQTIFGQAKPMIFTNHGNPVSFANEVFYSSRIHEITLNPDASFDFWSRPHVSCFTWQHYEGTWRKEKDSLLFFRKYEILENDTRTTYKKDSRQSFFINFKTDKRSALKNKTIKVQFIYDFDAQLKDSEMTFTLNADNSIEIPFENIPNLDKLSALGINYQLNAKENRHSYLTENKTLNKKQGDLPNLIDVEFVENPKKEIVYRTIKGVINGDTLVIFSQNKPKTKLQDYYKDIEFEDSYKLNK